MTIELTPESRLAIEGLRSKIQETRLRADAAIGAYQESIGLLMSAALKSNGANSKLSFQLNPEGTALISQEEQTQ